MAEEPNHFTLVRMTVVDDSASEPWRRSLANGAGRKGPRE
jgi:hypothetical protein